MKRKILSLFMAFVILLGVLSVSVSAFAASKTAVWNYYSKKGSHKVSTITFTVDSNEFTYKVWYPKDIEKLSKRPLILYCNGTGSNYERAQSTVEFLTNAASHGFICVNNTDTNCGTGVSMDAGMTKLIELNETKSSPLCGKINLDKVGIAGHSQGATCTMNLSDAKKYENAKYYKAVFAASLPTNALAESSLQNCPYDSSVVKIPTLLIAGTGATDQGFICPLETSLKPNFRNIKNDAYMARITDVEHADSIERSAPYMIAWFDFQLNGSKTAAKAFTGAKPELKTNSAWQDFKVKIKAKPFALSSVKKGKKSFKASWKKGNTVSGYQLQYSTSKQFKNKKTVTVANAKSASKTVKKLKAKKTYYVRVRSYTVIGKKTYYSKWSEVKSVKTK